jgi:hypothetical protein
MATVMSFIEHGISLITSAIQQDPAWELAHGARHHP